KQARIGPDYHVLYAKHAYSVPHNLVGQTVTLEATAQIICIYYQGNVVAQHPRKHQPGGFTTVKEHMPEAHVKQRWSTERLMGWANSIGSGCRKVITSQLQRRQHPEQAIKSCLAILNLASKYGQERLEAACQKALLLEQPHLKVITNLLSNNKERDTTYTGADEQPVNHQNIRGKHYYQ
ncbi:MAG: IS21 family transposase, partial [Actinobacteria bacterium]|nr:IS21 family transposase [Actinomycetota bacterium]